MSKPTPGPWRCYRSNWNLVYGPGGDLERDHLYVANEADARLIASAPSLLEACKSALEYLERDSLDDEAVQPVVTLLRAALRRVEEGGGTT